MPRTSNKPAQLLKGFKDILPEHKKDWDYFYAKALPLVEAHGFEYIDVPVLEALNLYYKATGKQTDIVEKELYAFQDKGGEKVALRPEFTPSICRAYIEHGMLNKPQPVKLYTYGPVFRHDNPQAGRFRQFNQLNLEVLGADSPVVDVQLILVAYQIFNALNIPVMVSINSLGDKQTRSNFIAKFKQFLSAKNRKKELCEDCKKRYSKNPLRILDCKQEKCQEIISEAPQIIDFLDEDSKNHFMQVLEYLDDLDVKYDLDTKLVRGLDYYNRTTFEFYLDYNQLKNQEELNEKKQNPVALLGGGRYDGLIEILGGRPTPAAGWAIGIERVISKLRELKIETPETNQVDVFIAQLGTEAKKEAFKLHQKLIEEDIKVNAAFPKDGLKAQLEKANQYKAKISLILGQKELLDRTIIIRDMQSGIQEIINYDKVIQEIKKRIDPNLSSIKKYKMKTKSAKSAQNQNKEIIETNKTELDATPPTKTNNEHDFLLEKEQDLLTEEDMLDKDYTINNESNVDMERDYDNNIMF